MGIMNVMRDNYEGEGPTMLALGVGQMGKGWFSPGVETDPWLCRDVLSMQPVAR